MSFLLYTFLYRGFTYAFDNTLAIMSSKLCRHYIQTITLQIFSVEIVSQLCEQFAVLRVKIFESTFVFTSGHFSFS